MRERLTIGMVSPADVQHTKISSECQADLIQELAENCDNEYYMSAGGPDLGNKDRAKRGLVQILTDIERFKILEKELVCPACLAEVNRQLQLQAEGVVEIKNVWQFE